MLFLQVHALRNVKSIPWMAVDGRRPSDLHCYHGSLGAPEADYMA